MTSTARVIAFARFVRSRSFFLTEGTVAGVLVAERGPLSLWLTRAGCDSAGLAFGLAAAGLLRGKLLDAVFPPGDDEPEP